MPTRPTGSMPRLANNPTTNRTEPPSGLKDVGFLPNQKLPAQFANWLWGVMGDWIGYFANFFPGGDVCQAAAFSHDTVDVRLVGANDWSDASPGMEVQNAGGASLPIRASRHELHTSQSIIIPVDLGAYLADAAQWYPYVDGSILTTAQMSMCSSMALKNIGWYVDVPTGMEVTSIWVDWHSPGGTSTPLQLEASKSGVGNSAPAAGPVSAGAGVIMRAAGPVTCGGTSRRWDQYVCDQNNTGFGFGMPYLKRLAICVTGSNASSGDNIYGIYVCGLIRGASMYAAAIQAS